MVFFHTLIFEKTQSLQLLLNLFMPSITFTAYPQLKICLNLCECVTCNVVTKNNYFTYYWQFIFIQLYFCKTILKNSGI